MRKRGVIALILIMTGFYYSFGQKPAVVLSDESGWTKIGETTASFKEQSESIVVWGADEFSAIKLKVNDAPLTIDRLQVFYESGTMEDIEVKREVQQGGETKTISLKQPDGEIQKVAFTYHTSPNYQGEKANVELYGLKKDDKQSDEAYRSDEERGNDQERDRDMDRTERDMDQSLDNTEQDLDSAAEATGDAISEGAAKAEAVLEDQKHETKVGPNGQTIYIDDDGSYYYIDEEGHRVDVPERQLKDKS